MVQGIIRFTLLALVAIQVAIAVEQIDEHEPQIMVACGKVSQHIDVKTGVWIKDANHTAICTTSKEEILKYCKKVYPGLDVQNIVKAQKAITFDERKVVPYRCIVGDYEADALLVPTKCNFKHLHINSKCDSEENWKQRAAESCFQDDMHLDNTGMLIPCGIDVFSGVEFVCCPMEPNEATHKPVASPSPQPLSLWDKLKQEVSKISKGLSSEMAGCDQSKYYDQKQKQMETHRARMSDLLKQWQQSEQRYHLLKDADLHQAKQFMSESLSHFKKAVKALGDQDTLEQEKLRENHQQCVQIDLNNKKAKALKLFVEAMAEEVPDAKKIVENLKGYLQACDKDRLHNLRYLEYVRKHHPDMEKEAVDSLRDHLKLLESKANDTLHLLFTLPQVARQLKPDDLPVWIPPLPALPTEAPTTEKPPPTGLPGLDGEHENDLYPTSPPGRLHDPEDDPEDEEAAPMGHRATTVAAPMPIERRQSSATFAAVVGLSCGALVIMVVIVIAMVMRKSRHSSTRTVLVEGEGDAFLEKRHLQNMQKNGYENPTYKFYDY